MKRLGRKSLVSGIMALSLVLAGTGYAYWTDTLQVTAKATTGDFGVTFADLGLYAQYDNEKLDGGWSIVDGVEKFGGFVNDEFFQRGTSDYNKIARDGSIEQYYKATEGLHNVKFCAELEGAEAITKNVGDYTTANTKGSDKINICIQKMYPGYAQAFRTDILNVGDIAAKLSKIKFDYAALEGHQLSGEVQDMLGVALLISREQYNPTHHEEDVFKLAKQFSEDDIFEVGGVKFVRLSAIDRKDLSKVLENNEILSSPTDQRMDLFLGVAMDPDAEGKYTTGSIESLKDNDDTLTQNQGAMITIDFGWDQFNVGSPNNASPNILANQN